MCVKLKQPRLLKGDAVMNDEVDRFASTVEWGSAGQHEPEDQFHKGPSSRRSAAASLWRASITLKYTERVSTAEIQKQSKNKRIY